MVQQEKVIMMKARTKFLRMFDKLPEKARANLIYNFYTNKPYSLNVCAIEIKNKTAISKLILNDLGFMDEE